MLEEDALASDVGPHFGNVPVGLGKMADTGIPDCAKSKPRLGRTSAKRSYGAGRPVCPLRQLLRGVLQYLPHEQHARFSASAAVTTVTGYSSKQPIIFWTARFAHHGLD